MKRLVIAALVACSGPAKPPIETPVVDKPAAPQVVDWTKLVGPIRSIVVSAQDASLEARVKELLANEVGKPIDRRRLRGELAQVLALKGVADVIASGKQLDDGVTLVLELAPQPEVHAIYAREVAGQDIPLPGQLVAAAGLPVDPGLIDALVAQLRTQYLAKGYTDVDVTWHQTSAGKALVDVTIEVAPGKASTVTTIEFKGNARVKKPELVKAMADSVAANAPWNIDQVERATLLLAAYYYDHGFVSVAIEAPKPSGTAAPAVFTIVEGDQYRVGKLEVTGVSSEEAKKLLAMIGAKKGDVFSRSAFANGIQKIQESSKQAVTPLTDIDPKHKTIDLKLEVTKP